MLFGPSRRLLASGALLVLLLMAAPRVAVWRQEHGTEQVYRLDGPGR